MSKAWTPGEFFGKTFHKGMGEPVFAGLLYHFGSLKFHYLPHDMDKILFPSGELKDSLKMRQQRKRLFKNQRIRRTTEYSEA